MARIPRLTVDGEPAVYHVVSHTALDGFVLGDVEKDYLLTLIQRLSAVYFTEVLGFCLMGNHFHLLVRMLPETGFSDRVKKGDRQTILDNDVEARSCSDKLSTNGRG